MYYDCITVLPVNLDISISEVTSDDMQLSSRALGRNEFALDWYIW